MGAKFYSLKGNGVDISKCSKGHKKDAKSPLNYEALYNALYNDKPIKQKEQFRCGKTEWLNEENPYQMTKVVVRTRRSRCSIARATSKRTDVSPRSYIPIEMSNKSTLTLMKKSKLEKPDPPEPKPLISHSVLLNHVK